MALSAVVVTTVSILPVMLKAIPLSVWRAALGLFSLMKSGYYRWMSPVKRGTAILRNHGALQRIGENSFLNILTCLYELLTEQHWC